MNSKDMMQASKKMGKAMQKMKDGGIVPEKKPEEKKIEVNLPAVEITAKGPTVQQIRDRYGDFDYTPRVRKMMTEARKRESSEEQKKALGGFIDDNQEGIEKGAGALASLTDKLADPEKTGGAGNAVATVGNALGDTASMAATGASVAGPVGAIAGAGIGLAKGVIGAITGGKQKREMIQQKKNLEGKKELSGIAQGMAQGGKIKGPGTGTSDSISSKLEEDDFIVPAKNADRAMEIGKKHFGWKDDQRASLRDGDVPVKVSNGEVRYTKDEADYLREVGEDIDSLAPDAKNGNNLANGGSPYITRTYKKGKFVKDNRDEKGDIPEMNPVTGQKITSKLPESKTPELSKTPDYSSMVSMPEKQSKFGNWMKKNPGVALGAAQTVAGIIGAARNAKAERNIKPITDPSPTFNSEAEKLKATADQTVSAIMNGTNQQGSDAMGNYLRVAKESGGSNASAVLANTAKVTGNSADNYLKGMQLASQVKNQAQEASSRMRAEGLRAGMESQIQNRAFNERRVERKTQNATDLITGGIQNASGQLMRNDYLDRMSETEKKYKGNLTGKYRCGGKVKRK